MRVALFTLMSMVCAVALAATVYKWVDENGVVHYSDQPHENAQKVQLAPAQTYKSQPVPQTNIGSGSQKANSYAACNVTAPANASTFQNADSVTVAADVSPAPHDGDQAVLLLDGAPVPNFPATGGSMTIPADRGEHSLQAIVRDANGKVLCQSSAVTFTVLQASVLNPANPNFANPNNSINARPH